MLDQFTDGRGYTTYVDRESNTLIRAHQLVALVENDPRDVFSENAEVHHLTPTFQSAGIKLDIPSGVCVIEKSQHRRLHASDEYSPVPIESVLNSRYTSQKESTDLCSDPNV